MNNYISLNAKSLSSRKLLIIAFCGLILFLYFIIKFSTFSPTQFSSIIYSSKAQTIGETADEKPRAKCMEPTKLDAFIRNLSNISTEQSLIPVDTLLTTIKFMIEERDEDDPELVEFVRSLIVSPPTSANNKLNLKDMARSHRSQYGQSQYVDEVLLNGTTNGFFIEAGGW
jgi:hypothetical protein